MAALTPGANAPDFAGPQLGGGTFSLSDALKKGPVIAAFFKISCPVCQFALPYVERLHQLARGTSVTVIGVSQNDQKATRQFMNDYGLTLPVLLDDPRSYPASNAYALTNVPTLFLISQDGIIEESIVGWDKADMERLATRITSANTNVAPSIFRPGEQVPDFKAG